MLQKGSVKLFDFGFARSLPETAEKPKNSKGDAVFRLTARMGTWRYMAPEVARGHAYNLKCDVYSFALVVWEMLVGQKPHAQLANGSDELKALVGTPPPLDHIDAKWQVLLQGAWHEKITPRWTMATVKQALEKLQQDLNQAKQQQQQQPQR